MVINDGKIRPCRRPEDIMIVVAGGPLHYHRCVMDTGHGLGKPVRVLVFAQGEAARNAENAGADYVGSDELAKKIEEGWLEFDTAIATPEMMSKVGKLGRVLGRRGLMPNPKSGTVVTAEDLPRVIEVNEKMSQKWGTGTCVIPAPLEVDGIMKQVPEGRLITINRIREKLAQKHGASFG